MHSINGPSNNSVHSIDTPAMPRTAAPRTTSITVDIQVPGLAKGIQQNAFDRPMQRVLLPEDFGAEYAAYGAHESIAAWNANHVFLFASPQPICVPSYKNDSTSRITVHDRQTGESLPPGGAIVRTTDPSHSMDACETLAEYRLNTEKRLMSYCVGDRAVGSMLADRGLYDLSDGRRLPCNEGKWMYRKNARGNELAPYAVMLLLEGKDRQDIRGFAGKLADQAEQIVTNGMELLSFLEKEGGPLSPVTYELRGKCHTEATQLIAELLDRHSGGVLLVTGDRARLIDAVSMDHRGNIVFTFRDAYIGAQRKIPDLEEFWQPTKALQPLCIESSEHRALRAEEPNSANELALQAREASTDRIQHWLHAQPDTNQRSMLGGADYLVAMEPRGVRHRVRVPVPN